MKTGCLHHPKVRRLKRQLQIPLYQAAGVLETLWHLTAEYADDGIIGRFSNEEIADFLEWDGDADAMIAALVAAGFLDEAEEGRLAVHDWADHAPKYIFDRLRKRKERLGTTRKYPRMSATVPNCPTLSATVPNCPELSPAVRNNPLLPNPTQPNPTQPKASPSSPDGNAPGLAVEELVERWNKIPRVRPCKKVTEARRKAFKARAGDAGWLDDLPEALDRVAKSQFCTGQGDRGWRADVDWLLRPDTITKLMEGKYDDLTGRPHGTGQGRRPGGTVATRSPARVPGEPLADRSWRPQANGDAGAQAANPPVGQ